MLEPELLSAGVLILAIITYRLGPTMTAAVDGRYSVHQVISLPQVHGGLHETGDRDAHHP